MCSRFDKEYHAHDLLSDILSRGNSSRLYHALVKDNPLFSEINAYVMGDFDKGLFVVSGKLSNGVEMETAEKAILKELEKVKTELVSENELQKCKNKVESSITFSETDILNKATNLAISELLGDAELINEEIGKYLAVNTSDIKNVANNLLNETNCSTLYYLKKK